MRKLLIAVAALALGAGDAAAQDSSYHWSGAYVGAQAGYGWGDYTPIERPGSTVDVKSGLGGVFAGYNWQLSNRLVLGAETDISTGLDGTAPSVPFGATHGCFPRECSVEIEWFATLRARVGYAFDRVHIYGTGGLAYAKTEAGIFNTLFPGKSSQTGWAAGAGLEYAFTDNMIVRGEYLHVDVGDIRFGDVWGRTYKAEGSFDTLRAGIAYKF